LEITGCSVDFLGSFLDTKKGRENTILIAAGIPKWYEGRIKEVK
jgi:hypothetical protein